MTLPAVDDLATFGGAKQNYADVEDPLVDLDAAHHNKMAADIAMGSHLVPRAACSFTTDAATPTDPDGFIHDACWGDSVPVKPVVTRDAQGVFDVEWPATVSDELAETHDVALRRAWATTDGTTPLMHSVTRTDGTTFRVRLFDAAGAATDAAGTVVTIFAI